jgi:hypothetical protein
MRCRLCAVAQEVDRVKNFCMRTYSQFFFCRLRRQNVYDEKSIFVKIIFADIDRLDRLTLLYRLTLEIGSII